MADRLFISGMMDYLGGGDGFKGLLAETIIYGDAPINKKSCAGATAF
ncbi:MAG: hypothetical protein KKD73_04180 [Proteobacteria bacterium]|nr:hypothetical protein [Pseudomonadota bacterium]MBU1639680.1 hypothetical protein [Pseudomonadota bacterium]